MSNSPPNTSLENLVSSLNISLSWDVGSNDTSDRGPPPAGLLRHLAHKTRVSLFLLSLHQWMVKNRQVRQKRPPSRTQKRLTGAVERRKGKKKKKKKKKKQSQSRDIVIHHPRRDSSPRGRFGSGMTALGEGLMRRYFRCLLVPLGPGPLDLVLTSRRQQGQLPSSAGTVAHSSRDLWEPMSLRGRDGPQRHDSHHRHRRPGGRRSRSPRSRTRHLAFVGLSEGLLSYYVRCFTVWAGPGEWVAASDDVRRLVPPSPTPPSSRCLR